MMCRRFLADTDFLHPISAVIPGTQGRVLAVLAGHVAARAVLDLAAASERVLADIGNATAMLAVPPDSVINSAEVLEVPIGEIAARLQGRRAVWHGIRPDGRIVHGLTLDDLAGTEHG